MKVTRWLKEHNITAPAILLFTALLAQAPHAAFVFNRVSQHSAEWEIWAGAIGALVYAIALEGATAYFVWKNSMKWAIGFAAFSVAHNIAYYMPATWTFTAWGAVLTVRDTFSAILISFSIPVAIAAFSHVQAQRKHAQEAQPDAAAADDTPATPAQQPDAPAIAQPAPVAPEPEPATPATTPAQPTARKGGKVGKTNEWGLTDTALADMLGVSRQRIAPMRDKGTLMARVARDLPQLEPVHTNGFNHE